VAFLNLERECRAMESAEELRVAARRLTEAANNLSDPEFKKELTSFALRLSERADAIARTIENPEIIRMNIDRYQAMLAGRTINDTQRKVVGELLADAKTLLSNLSKKQS
jgi:hypothetical protein